MSKELSTALAGPNVVVEQARKWRIQLLVKVMRPHQWVKNLFIFAPLLFGGKLADLPSVGAALVAFCSFCLLSSSLYIYNDWIDAEEDRAHPEKRTRPISSGELPVSVALAFSVVLAACALALAWTVGSGFLGVAVAYFVLILAYGASLKRLIVIDCIVIATGFVLRVVGGAVAVSVLPTHWLIVCAFLLALFLAFSKRRQELLILSGQAAGHRKVLGLYTIPYLEQVNIILIGTTLVSYALYTVAPETIARFGTDALIYGTVFVIYGVLRYLALINDPQYGGNPSKMLLRDRPLLLAIIGWSVFNAIIIYRERLMGLLSGLWS
jgi:4-hydroxybenzoate polyprenyltransferase